MKKKILFFVVLVSIIMAGLNTTIKAGSIETGPGSGDVTCVDNGDGCHDGLWWPTKKEKSNQEEISEP